MTEDASGWDDFIDGGCGDWDCGWCYNVPDHYSEDEDDDV